MKKVIFVLMFAVVLSGGLLSFKKADTEPEMSKTANYPFTFYTTSLPETRSGNFGEIVLGNNMGIPFSLSNMRDAAQFIDENSELGLTTIVPTHYYVKFMPVTNEHLIILDSLGDTYALYNYPIEYVIVQEGDHMARSSSVSTSTYNKFDPIYASIPINDILPDVPYNIVDTLCDPNEDDNDLMITSYVLTGNASELGILYNGEIFTENSLKEYLLLPNATRASVKYLPNGHLKVYDTEKEDFVPVKNTSLKLVRFGIPYIVKTDEYGYFEFDKKIIGKIDVKASWKNGDYTIRKSWNEMIGIATSDYICEINKNNTGNDIEIDNTVKPNLWYKATVSNALQKYNEHMESCGVTGVHDNANVWVVIMERGVGGAAPLAKKYAWSVTYNVIFSDYMSFLLPITYPKVTVLNLLFRDLYPDLVFTITDGEFRTDDICRNVFHEAAHFSHGLKAGNVFWGNFVQDEVANIIVSLGDNPYGDGTYPSIVSGKRIALAEGWAYFCESKCMVEYYGDSGEENFNMQTIPSQNMFAWHLTGLFWDIFDANFDTNSYTINGQNGDTLCRIIDYLQIGNMNNLAPVYNKLIGDVNNGIDLKNRLLLSYPSKGSQINQLFLKYLY